MFKNKKNLAIIPARAGSKGIPKKNIIILFGKPLIAWTIERALASKYLDKIIVSTDGPEIAEISKKYGAEVPFMRPAELAVDNSPTSDTVLHALDYFECYGIFFDYVAILEPTSPLRKQDDIDNGIKKIIENPNADSLVSVGEVHMEHPSIVKKIENNLVVPYITSSELIYQRQQLDKAYFPYGVIYLSKVSSFKVNKTFYTKKTIPLFIERWQNYEVDDEIDFMLIEKIMEKKYLR